MASFHSDVVAFLLTIVFIVFCVIIQKDFAKVEFGGLLGLNTGRGGGHGLAGHDGLGEFEGRTF
jgi:hypothetical protein